MTVAADIYGVASKKLILGAVLIAASSLIGWIALAAGAALSARYGRIAAQIGGLIWGLSWILLAAGVWIGGKDAVSYSKELLSSLLKKKVQ